MAGIAYLNPLRHTRSRSYIKDLVPYNIDNNIIIYITLIDICIYVYLKYKKFRPKRIVKARRCFA